MVLLGDSHIRYVGSADNIADALNLAYLLLKLLDILGLRVLDYNERTCRVVESLVEYLFALHGLEIFGQI